ncbi:uncharacterized protein LOC127722354 [Mytilus californianus]|uniref:uncharacterized protein LOC127722354 n=1 Tax=Mytilus californianus TaxID=6549 RepID=UPI0022480C05|nr:uncharacterized protein LOC127722354 [Mytilus californianus]
MSKHLKDQIEYEILKGDLNIVRLSIITTPVNHKGTLFFTMIPIQLDHPDNVYAQFIITTDQQTKVDFLSEYADINRSVVITTGVAYIDIPSSVLMLGIGRTYATVLIQSDQLITVVGFFGKSHCSLSCESSCLIVLPATVSGMDYSIITQPNNKQNCGIMATETNTTVVIESASVRSISIGSTTIKPRQKFIIVIDYLEGFHIQTDNHLTATKIYANKPIVVISGNRYASLKKDFKCLRYCSYYSDIVYESLIPVDKWSRHFIIPLIHKASRYSIRIVSRNKNATITIQDYSGVSITKHGDLTEVDLSAKSYYVSASNPILLSLYTITENKGINMMILPGIEHFSKDYIIAPPKDPFHTSYISIIIKSSDVDGLRFVGNRLAVESTVIMARNESFITVVKKMGGHSVYKIRHLSKDAFYGVIVYGVGSNTAYGYPAGFRF